MDARATRYAVRLRCSDFYVEMQFLHANGGWIAVATTPDGPSIGWGPRWFNAAIVALQPFDGRIIELLRTAPAALHAEDQRG